MQTTKKGKGKKKVAAAPLAAKKKQEVKKTNPLFEKRPKNFGIGKLVLKFMFRFQVLATLMISYLLL